MILSSHESRRGDAGKAMIKALLRGSCTHALSTENEKKIQIGPERSIKNGSCDNLKL